MRPAGTSTSDSIQREPVRVLVVEDNERMREHLCDLIRRTPGLEVAAQVDSVAAACAALATSTIHSVTLDLRLSDGSGFEVLRTIRASGNPAAVIVVTNNAQPVYREACLAAGAAFFCDKSDDLQIVPQLILRANCGEREDHDPASKR